MKSIDRVAAKLPQFGSYIDSIPPTPFLDDTTTKNVIVHEGRLSGIVDTDEVCFGDPLFVVGLTKMALLSLRQDTDYIRYWCDALKLSTIQRHIVDLYTAIFCVNFLSEFGQTFNQHIEPDANAIEFLESTLEAILKQV